MILLVVSLTGIVSLGAIVIGLGYFLSLKEKESLVGSGPFECGFSSSGGPRLNFSVQFFLVALIFIVFDMELILLFPLFTALSRRISSASLLVVLFFLFTLTLGLFFEWNQGALNWAE